MNKNKIAFVTGGDKGIGQAIVEHMATSFELVIFTYNKNQVGADAITAKYSNTISIQCDLNNTDRLSILSSEIINKHKHIDVLINNAGYESDAIFTKMTEEQWSDVININLKSIYYFSQKFIPSMVESEWGRIINLTSIAGYTGVFGKANYASAKAGIVGFTKSLALELGGKGITVNAIAPGAIETEMLMRIPEKYRSKILENIPAKRFGKTEDVAHLVDFLVSDKSSYINGQTIHINGGSFTL